MSPALLPLVGMLACALAPIAAQHDDLGSRVEALLFDLEDPLLASAARIELAALGRLAARAIAEQCISPPRHSGYLPSRCWQPVLQAMGAEAKPALELALEVAANDRIDGAMQWRARELVEALALTVPATAAAVARLPVSDRLRVRLALGPDPGCAALVHALSGDDVFALEAALEILARRGAAGAEHASRVRELWGERAHLRVNLEVDAEPMRLRLLDLLAETLIAIQPEDQDIGAAYAQALRIDRAPPQKIAVITAIGALGSRARDAVPALVDALLHFDDAVCRAALEAITRLGAVAASTLPAIEDRIEHAADKETQRLARIARRRISRVPDVAGQVEDLIADLVHAHRWKAAALELGALGAPAAEHLLAHIATPNARHAGSVCREIVRSCGPAAGAALADRISGLLASPERRSAEATHTWLTMFVDLAVDTGTDAPVRACLARASAVGLVARLDALVRLRADASEERLRRALQTGSVAEAALAARLLRGAARLDQALAELLVEVIAREVVMFEGGAADLLARDAADPCGDAARTLVEHAGNRPISIAAYAWLLRHEWHVGTRVALLRRLGDARAFAADAARLAAGALEHQDDDLVRAAADAIARLGPAARDVERALAPIAAQTLNRANARAAQRALVAIRESGR